MLYLKGLILCVGDPIVAKALQPFKSPGHSWNGKSLCGLSGEEFTPEEDGHGAGVDP